jgi:lipid A disaccharide synthetase
MSINIAIISGEASGDLIAAGVVRQLYRLIPDLNVWGFGSEASAAAGVELLADTAGWGGISIVHSVGQAPGLLLKMLPRFIKELKARKPAVVVLIDFGFANRIVAKRARKLGFKVVWYFPPGAAHRRTGTKGKNLAAITDLLIVPFEWSAERLRGLGCTAVSVGNPIIERTHSVYSRADFASLFGLDPSRPIIGLLPGSRKHEIEHLMPTLIEAARHICREVKDAQFVVAVAPGTNREKMLTYLVDAPDIAERLGDIWHEFVQEAETRIIKPVARTADMLAGKSQRRLVTVQGLVVPEDELNAHERARQRSSQLRSNAERAAPPVVLAKGVTSEVMAHSDLLLVCSGTATLEAAAFGTPMLILYRYSKMMALEIALVGAKKRIKMIGLPNILAQRIIVPELIQENCTPETITAHAVPLLNDVSVRSQMKADLAEIREMLGTAGVSERAALHIMQTAGLQPLPAPDMAEEVVN